MKARSIAKWSEYALLGRHSSAARTNGAGASLGVARQLLEIALEARHCEIDEGAHLRHGQTSLRRQQMHWQRRVFVLVEEDSQSSVPDLLGDVIGKEAGDPVAFRGGGHRGANRIDDEPWSELHHPRHRRVFQRRKTPGVLTEMRHRNNP